jgi:DNA polymerase delta subunit 1
MMAWNMCYSTFIKDTTGLDPETYNTISWEEVNDDNSIKYQKYYFIKQETFHGVLPRILEKLGESRKHAKKLMANAETKNLVEIYNKLQSAYKVSMNSIYGFLAAQMLTCKPIAASVTAVGRKMIRDTKNFMEKNYKGCVTVYGDTDSCFLQFNTDLVKSYELACDRVYSQPVITEMDLKFLKNIKTKCVAEAIEIGKKASKEATNVLFKKPIKLEYEKVYFPLMLLSKKRYTGELYSENPEKFDKIDSKGIVLKRRDTCELLREKYTQICGILMDRGNRGLDNIKNIINGCINDIIIGNIDIDKLVITKAFKPPYKSLNLPQVVLARKIAERDPGKAPRSNDRLSYLFMDTDIPKIMPQYTKVEDPVYFKEHNLKIDTEYYITCLIKPISEILSLYIKDPESIFQEPLMKYKKERKDRLLLLKPKISKAKIIKQRKT